METEVAICQITIDEPNAQLLEKIISKVDVEIVSNSDDAFDVIDHYYAIAEDCLSAQLIYVLNPLSYGNIILQMVSSEGQKCEITIKSGKWGTEYQWGFANEEAAFGDRKNGYYITSDD